MVAAFSGAAIFIWGEGWRVGMLNRKRMGGKIKGCKERGEWAELYFMMLALEHGLQVSKPWGDTGRYDVGVEGRGRIQMGAGEVDDLQAAEWGIQLECDGSAAEKVCAGDGGFFCHPAGAD